MPIPYVNRPEPYGTIPLPADRSRTKEPAGAGRTNEEERTWNTSDSLSWLSLSHLWPLDTDCIRLLPVRFGAVGGQTSSRLTIGRRHGLTCLFLLCGYRDSRTGRQRSRQTSKLAEREGIPPFRRSPGHLRDHAAVIR